MQALLETLPKNLTKPSPCRDTAPLPSESRKTIHGFVGADHKIGGASGALYGEGLPFGEVAEYVSDVEGSAGVFWH